MRRKEEVWIAYILSNAKVITRLCESKEEMCAEDNWYSLWTAASFKTRRLTTDSASHSKEYVLRATPR